jgi:hypothetical protein
MDWVIGEEQAMKELQKQSVILGDVALVLGIAAFALILSAWPARYKIKAAHGILSATPKESIWSEYFGQCVFDAGIVLFGDNWPCCHDSYRRKFSA